jgi:single-stranded-DNA-specific exonuclease
MERFSYLQPLVAQILYSRDIVALEEVEDFLEGAFAPDNPFLLKGVEQAVALIREAIRQGHRIVVYGDYDVDGVTASAILVLTLRALGAQVEAYIPNREDEGYGLNQEAITSLAEQGFGLLITVDCGTRSPDEVRLAQALGMRVIITDHHHLGQELPPAEAVINPRQPDCPYPFKDLAGAGVAYKLAQALLRVNAQVPLSLKQQAIQDQKASDDLRDETELLDLVALGTVADMVPLLGENHVLVQRGLQHINAAYRPGIAALMQVAGVTPGKVMASTISFGLAPRINAVGRLTEAMTALRLLLAPDMARAGPLAQELDRINRERQDLTREVQEHAREIVLAQACALSEAPARPGASDQSVAPLPLLFAASETFPMGIVGLAASRLVDEFYRPAVVVSVDGAYARGSARSIPEFHITHALDQVADLLVRHGGHAGAAGFTVHVDNLATLQHRLIAIAQEQLRDVVLTPVLTADAELSLGMLSWDLYKAFDVLRPFGFGNPEPVFITRRVKVLNARAVGAEGRHLKLALMDARTTHKVWEAIAFRQGDWMGRLPPSIDIAYMLQRNEWNGRVTLQLNVLDIHPTE